MTTIEKLGLLQEEFFKKSGKLYENIELLGEVLYKSMLDDMTAVYTRESGLLLREAEAEYSATDYKLVCKEGLILPSEKRSILFRKVKRNAPAELIYQEVLAEAKGIFNRRTEAIEKLAAALEKSSADTYPNEEPPVEPILEEPAPETLESESEIEEQPAEQQPANLLLNKLETPAAQSESDPPQPPKKKHKRGNNITQPTEQSTISEAPTAPSKASEQPTEPLKLEEVPTNGGAQICLNIP